MNSVKFMSVWTLSVPHRLKRGPQLFWTAWVSKTAILSVLCASFPVAGECVWRWPPLCSSRLIFYSWMNRPTTWTWKRQSGWKIIWRNIAEHCWLSAMTAQSWILSVVISCILTTKNWQFIREIMIPSAEPETSRKKCWNAALKSRSRSAAIWNLLLSVFVTKPPRPNRRKAVLSFWKKCRKSRCWRMTRL